MNDDLDPDLLAIFEAAGKEPLDDGFVSELMVQIDRERHRGLIIWLIVAIVVVGVGALLAGPVTATLDMVGQLLPTSLINIETSWLQQLFSPVNSVAAALAIGILGVRVFWRRIFGE